MAEGDNISSSHAEMEEEFYDEDSLFDIGLHPTGDEGSAFRTQNDPAAPYQRQNLIERKGAIDIRCTCLDVVHGLFTPENDKDRATLVVLKFNFDSRKRARRIAKADIILEFSTSSPGGTHHTHPEVFKIAPFGNMSMVPTTAQQEQKHNAGFKLGAPPLAGFEAGIELGWERTITSETTDATSIVGSIDLRGRNWGPSNSASWTLLENETTETGVPTVLRTAVLLKRKNDEKFECTLKLKAHVDFQSKIQGMIGGKPKDDPLLFDPDMDPTNRLETYDIYNLSAVDLDKIAGVTFRTIYDRAVEHV